MRLHFVHGQRAESPRDVREIINCSLIFPQELADRMRPRVLGSYTNHVPFLIEREIGRGRVLLITTGVFREWSTLTSTDAVVIFERMFRDLLQRTLPRRSTATTEQIVFPVPPELRSAQFALADPAGHEEPASIDALGGQDFGIAVANLPARGVYRLVARPGGSTPQSSGQAKLLDLPFAANGPAEESELRYLDEAGVRERAPQAEFRWVGPGETIRLTAGSALGQDFWKWLMAAVLVTLFGESAILAWPFLRREPKP